MNSELNAVLVLEKLLIDKRKLYIEKITRELKQFSRRNRIRKNYRKYYLKNRDKVKENQRKFYLKNKDKLKEKRRNNHPNKKTIL